MAAVKQFEELLIWGKARRLADAIDARCTEPPLSRQFVLADQMRRSSLSIMSNIAEGFDLSSPRHFRHFLRIAKASAAELRSQLYLCSDRGYLDPALTEGLQKDTREIARMLMALIRYLDRHLTDGSR